LSDNVLIKINDVLKKTKGGIFLPNTAQEKPNKGVVAEVGSKSIRKVGEKVCFTLGEGMYIDKNEVIMKESSIIYTY